MSTEIRCPRCNQKVDKRVISTPMRTSYEMFVLEESVSLYTSRSDSSAKKGYREVTRDWLIGGPDNVTLINTMRVYCCCTHLVGAIPYRVLS